jgi:hypothetical protein
MEDPEGFLKSLEGKRVVLDEVHRLRNPSELLKIAADHYPAVRVVATGSSTLGATRKFRDSLTGRKAELWLTPAMSRDLESLHVKKLEHRLYRGGPPRSTIRGRAKQLLQAPFCCNQERTRRMPGIVVELSGDQKWCNFLHSFNRPYTQENQLGQSSRPLGTRSVVPQRKNTQRLGSHASGRQHSARTLRPA